MRSHGVRLIVGLVAGAMAGIAALSQAQSPPVPITGTWQKLPNTKIRDVLPDSTGYPIDPLTTMALWNPVNIMDYSGGVQIPSEREVVVDGGGHHEQWHPRLKKVVVRGRNHIALYDPFAKGWEEKAHASWNESEMSGLLDTKRKRLVSIGHGRSEVWDLQTWQPIHDSEDAKGPIPFSGPVFHDAFGPGFVYDEIGDQYSGWTWRNPSMLYSVNPDTWAITAAPMAGTPPAQLAWSSGTFGRFSECLIPSMEWW